MKNLHQIKNTNIPLWVQQLWVAWSAYDANTVLAYDPSTQRVKRIKTSFISESNIGAFEKEWRIDLHWQEKMEAADLRKFDPDKVKIV